MADVVSLTVIKRFTYRGDATEEWSNKYYLTGGLPADNTAWKALSDALILQEKTCYTTASSVVRVYGYNSDDTSPSAVWSWDYLAHGTAVPGLLSVSSATDTSGDQAGVMWWKTDRLNSRGRPIYLRKYFHGAKRSGTPPDSIETTCAAAYDALAIKLSDGSFLDARKIRSRTHADAIVATGHDVFITTRTLKRRGKRPS